MTRLYQRNGIEGEVLAVRLTETYPTSAHWIVEIQPRGFGVNPPWLQLKYSDEEASYEGNNFRIELAAYIAKTLTGAKDYIVERSDQ
jgi:hypothetical protein